MVHILHLAGRLAVGLAMALPLQAQASSDLANAPIRFRYIEGEMPADPLLASSDPMWKPHSTPAAWLEDARSQLALVVPRGTAAPVALANLQAAGARCQPNVPDLLSCRYHGAETRDEYIDDIRWTVDLALVQGKVDHMTVARTWTRR